MAREYKVTSMQVAKNLNDKTDVVTKIDFSYGDATNFLTGFCVLPEPGDSFIQLNSISNEMALEWLKQHLKNTTEEFDAQLDKKELNTYSHSFPEIDPGE